MTVSQRSPYTGYAFTVPPYVIPPVMHPAMYIEDPQIKAMQQMTHNCVQKTVLSGAMGFVMGGAMGLFMASMRYDTPFHTPTPSNTPSIPSAVPTAASTHTNTSANTSTSASPGTPPSSSTAPPAAPKPNTPSTAPTSISSSAAARASAPPAATAAAAATATPAVDSMSTWGQVKHGFRDMGRSSYSMAKNFSKVGAIFAGVECGIEGLRGRNDFANPVAAGCLTGGILAKNAGPQAAAGGCIAFAAFSAAIEAWLRSDSSSD